MRLRTWGKKINFNAIMERIADEGSAHNIDELPANIKKIFRNST